MRAFLEPIAELAVDSDYPELERQLAAGLAARGTDTRWPGPALRLAVTGWTRLHGVISLEVEGHFDPWASTRSYSSMRRWRSSFESQLNAESHTTRQHYTFLPSDQSA